MSSTPVPQPKPPAPRILGPNGVQQQDTCQNCKFWIVRADDPQKITRCCASQPMLFTVQMPQVKKTETSTEIVGMMTQVTSDFPPAAPWWSCGSWKQKLFLR